MTTQTDTRRQNPKKAVILLSGGLDSYTAAAMAQSQGFECYGLTVNYGQRHRCELARAAEVAKNLKLSGHIQIDLDLTRFGGSALTDQIEVPKSDGQPPGGGNLSIPPTYVPARNTILLSVALGWAETLEAFDIFIGVNAVDYSGYPDCRAEFIASFEGLANIATKAAVEQKGHFAIHAPLLFMSKSEIITQGRQLKLDYSLTHSCYDPDAQNRSCGKCEACLIRLKGFRDAHLPDPIEYVK